MSIPPLVCSTPPPPDQCEDDKDHEDFGLQYHLSQDDDEDENYDYGNFSSYNHYETEVTAKKIETPTENTVIEKGSKSIKETDAIIENNIEEIIENNEQFNVCKEIGTNIVIVDKLKCDEDINIEDLNLILDKESICPNIEDNDGQIVIENNNTDRSVKKEDIPSIIDDIPGDLNACVSPSDIGDVVISSKIIINTEGEISTFIDEITEEEPSINPDLNKDEHVLVTEEEMPKEEPFIGIERYSEEKKDVVEDDFGEFDDFKFISPDIRLANSFVDNCENPWGNKVTESTLFGDFTANFDENVTSENSLSLETDKIPDDNHLENKVIPESYNDDDFSDFDDFKSSTNNTVENKVTAEDPLACQDVPVLNLHSAENEHQVMENINKVLSLVFPEEIIEPENEFEGKLESLLSETWVHIMETDVRQPYIVNWNNSLGQKTLLRALCIDSRNILFGPKWGYNMPKYAANLTTAPLQPQKQVATSSVYQSEAASTDKSVTKPNTWGDPFTSDGQESCNTNQSAVTESGPADVFEAALPTKSDKIFSSTLNVQPLRQINLPDTHIFTPTDSETPRSKTIHYDSGLPVLLPQPVIENCKNQSQNFTSKSISSMEINNKDNDTEYWDFQDFKSKLNNTLTLKDQDKKIESMETIKGNNASNSALPKAVQILQPIKLEPIMPTLNWPDPGEVSEVFDDFSDFVSNSSWNNDNTVDLSTSESHIQKPSSESPNATDIKIEREKSTESSKVEMPNNNDISFDDEFDRFQSAIPPYNINKGDTMNNQTVPSTQIEDFVYEFPKNDVKSDTISFSNDTRQNTTMSQNYGHLPSITEITNKNPTIQISSGLHSKLLQPIAASSNVTTTQNQQKSGQILQPLSLESYSQINWPSPGIDLQDLSRFNPVETLQSLKTDLSVNNQVKMSSPMHSQNSYANKQTPDDDVWGDFVSSNPKQQQSLPKKSPTYADDDEWTEFVSSPSVKPQNGLNTISLNVHTNLKLQKSSNQSKISIKNNQIPLEIPTLNYITKAGNHDSCNNRHFQNL